VSDKLDSEEKPVDFKAASNVIEWESARKNVRGFTKVQSVDAVRQEVNFRKNSTSMMGNNITSCFCAYLWINLLYLLKL
jgi:hypothetical protein